MDPTQRETGSLAVGLLPDGRFTCPEEVCDNASLRSALSAYGAINSGDVATFVLLDGWRRVHVTTLDAKESLDVLRACGRIARVAQGSVVDTIHLAADPHKTHEAVMGYRLGSDQQVPLSISRNQRAPERLLAAFLSAQMMNLLKPVDRRDNVLHPRLDLQ